MAGKEPSAEDLLDAGVQSFDSEDGKGIEDPGGQIDSLLSKLDNDEGGSSSHPPMQLVTIGTGLPALSKKLVARVLANEYIDFAELPPAKGKGRPMPQSLEGQDYRGPGSRAYADQEDHTRLSHMDTVFCHLCSDTMFQATGTNTRLMAYQTIIAKASQRYRWPSWVVYDQNFRQEAPPPILGQGGPKHICAVLHWASDQH